MLEKLEVHVSLFRIEQSDRELVKGNPSDSLWVISMVIYCTVLNTVSLFLNALNCPQSENCYRKIIQIFKVIFLSVTQNKKQLNIFYEQYNIPTKTQNIVWNTNSTVQDTENNSRTFKESCRKVSCKKCLNQKNRRPAAHAQNKSHN